MRRAAAEVNSLAGWPPCAQARSLLDEDVKDAERLSRERGNLPPTATITQIGRAALTIAPNSLTHAPLRYASGGNGLSVE